tara:strand:+ start:409 stop:1200 length:792 start_codon:yes stop_codon:yes gene_type:complete
MKKTNYWFECQSVEVWDHDHRIFENLTLKLNKNQYTMILGPNGAGKSAIVGLINRTLYPIFKNESFLKLFGKNNINIWDLRTKIGVITSEIEARFHKEEVVFDLVRTGLYNSLSMKQHKDINDNDLIKVNKVLEQSYLKDIKDYKFKILSDGQKRRVMIARALINDPEILVLDEPTSRLDIKSKLILLESLTNFSKKGTTILHITHDTDLVSEIVDRVILVKSGTIIGDGSPNIIMTSKNLSKLYDLDLKVEKIKGKWLLRQS